MKLLNYMTGVLLLIIAASVLLINLTAPATLIPPSDPIFNISTRTLFWIVGLITLFSSVVCLFDAEAVWPVFLGAWIATNFAIYQKAARWQGCHGLTGYLGGFTQAFGISAQLANGVATMISACLLAASYGMILRLWWGRKADAKFIKMPCPACGVHIKYIGTSLGQKIPCPHCQDENPSQFSREFKRYWGHSPNEHPKHFSLEHIMS